MSTSLTIEPEGVAYEEAVTSLDAAANRLFDADPRVRSVGVSRIGTRFGFRAVRNSAAIVPLNANTVTITDIQGIPIKFADAPGEVESLLLMPAEGPGSPQAISQVPETHRFRPLCGGLQIQNFDDDVRQGVVEKGLIIIGTLGCFVRLADDTPAILSNNHVIAGENRGIRGVDRILQAGSSTFSASAYAATLSDFEPLRASPPGAMPAQGNIVYNEIDAGVAALVKDMPFEQGYLPFRKLVVPFATATPKEGDVVFKVGRTTGLTRGKIVEDITIVGPVAYDVGPCWFRRSFTIEGLDGSMFSDRGDSGSAIVKESGEVVGILYAGNGVQTYACPIDPILNRFECTIL